MTVHHKISLFKSHGKKKTESQLHVQIMFDLTRKSIPTEWALLLLRAATNESQKTRNKKQNGLAHLRFLVCVTPKQNKSAKWHCGRHTTIKKT